MDYNNIEPRPADKTVDTDKRIFRFVIVTILVLFAALVVSVLAGCGGADPVLVKAAPAVATTAPAASQPNAKHVVEIIVTGSHASITYGAGETIFHTSRPLHRTFITNDTTTYDVNVALKNGGVAHCTIMVNGKVVAHKSVSGLGGFMSCVAYRDQHNGRWLSMYS